MARKKTTTSKRLRRSATAYRRLAWRRDTTSRQADHYLRLAEKLDRQAEREENR
jgi:hypothetical protein